MNRNLYPPALRSLSYASLLFCLLLPRPVSAQEIARWDKTVAAGEHTNIQWFKDAKFGLFLHWGLYSAMAGKWKDKDYYGSGEWLMNRARIPATEYAQTASQFNPVDFNADQWAKFAKDAGVRYLVITAKHHEGFSMYDSKVSDFNIVKATPYKKDPMKALSEAVRKQGIRFGFYYSQFLDWHEPNGGGNDWDFNEEKKDYQQYYRDKSLPQIKELLTNYGPLGILWFDMPGGLTKEQTKTMVDSLHLLQPNALFSSRVGEGMGDYRDFGDSEVPPLPIAGAWEAIYTHNDSWGYITHDMNFKSPEEIIRLLANVASKGGNLMLNVGPDGTGRIPAYSVKYLLATGKWLRRFGAGIYGTTFGLVPAQPWGVTTSKPGKLFLHVFERPSDGRLRVPGFGPGVIITGVSQLDNHQPFTWKKEGNDLIVDLPSLTDKRNTVLEVAYKGLLEGYDLSTPVMVSSTYATNAIDAVFAKTGGDAATESITYSHYFGDWKHATCITKMKGPADSISFRIRVTDGGDYKILLEYACPEESSGQEGVCRFNGQDYKFQTLRTSSSFDESKPVLFIQHAIAIITVPRPGLYTITLAPFRQGKELFTLKSILLQPVR